MAVLHITFNSECLGRSVPLTVILPTDKMSMPNMPKPNCSGPFKTLYLLHGVIGSCNDWLYGTRIQRWAEERNLCVVMPSGDNYMYLDNPVDKYGEYVGSELVAFTRRSFPLSDKREDTYIGGLSMGGFGALRNGLKYHKTFGAIISLSAALVVDESLLIEVEHPVFPSDMPDYKHWVYGKDIKAALESDVNPRYLVKTLAKEGASLPAIYMAIGDDDFLLQQNLAFHELLCELGIEHTFEQHSGGHEWDFWDSHIKRALEWLPLDTADAGRSSGNVN